MESPAAARAGAASQRDEGTAMSAILTYKGAVYPWHCDHMGHMNVMWYVGKFDEANWNLFARIGLTPSYLRAGYHAMAAVQQNIAYRRELLASDVVEVASRVMEVREKLLRFLHEMREAESGEIAATCELTVVHMDRRARKASALPAQARAAAEALLGAAE
jgi:acyl-CoA thioester hydrolase